MANLLEKQLQNYPRSYLTDVELESLLDGTPDSRYGKVKRLLAKGMLLRIKRGLYCITNEIGYLKKPHPFELAEYIYGPSFISLESALSYHHLIPEAVYVTTSVTSKRSKTMNTPLGRFSYQCVPHDSLYTEVTLIKKDGVQFFIAKPWRAICDYIYCYRKNWDSFDPLIKNLRINLDYLPNLESKEIQLLDEYYDQKRIHRFLQCIYQEWNHKSK